MNKPKLHSVNTDGGPSVPVPDDMVDIEKLWLDPALGDGIVNVSLHSVPVGKPKDFFRTVTDSAYRRRTELYTHKVEGTIDEAHYIVAPPMHGKIVEARPCTLVTVVYRDGSPRIWPISFPRAGEKDNDAWISARAAARIGMEKWTKLVWVRRSYHTREARPGFAPDPDFSKLPSFNELLQLAFGGSGIIRDETHSIYRDLCGSAPIQPADKADGLGDI